MAFFTVRAIIPKDVFADTKKISRAVETTFNNAARAIKVDFDVTTQTWKRRPTFTITVDGPGSRTIATSDEIYSYVDEGTPPHLIRPRNKSILRWNYPFRPKTRVRYIGSNAGGVGKQVAWAHLVHHPGTKARAFTDEIHKKWDEQFPIQLQRAIDVEVD